MKENNQPSRTLHKLLTWLGFDGPLCMTLLLLMGIGFLVLYSAAGNTFSLMPHQTAHVLMALLVFFLASKIKPHHYQHWTPWFFCFSLLLLLAVLITGSMGKGAQRWLNLSIIRFQPSELLKLSVPMMTAWLVAQKPLPPSKTTLCQAFGLIFLPAFLVAKQPDLGTAILIASSGFFVLFLGSISWRFLSMSFLGVLSLLPVLWHFLHDYQRKRILNFLNPEHDPLGSGYHIIQSKIAIGSGGLWGKGWQHSTQSHLHFLPEHATDFVFALIGEEFGFIGAMILLCLYLFITFRSLYMASQTSNTYTRLLTGTLTVNFFIAVFVNIGMVSGILPVVGLPLPLMSYGGSALLTTLMIFGIINACYQHRTLLGP